MRRFSIRYVLLGVAAASLIAPVVALLGLRWFDVALLRQTERELNSQVALAGATWRELTLGGDGSPAGNPRDRWHRSSSFTPYFSRLVDLDEIAEPVPDPLPFRKAALPPEHRQASATLSAILKSAQVFNLSGVRVLDSRGCAVASSRGQLNRCFSGLPEVSRALRGVPTTVIRERISDEPRPALNSLRRRGDLRLFVSVPIWNDGEVVGAVLASRTAESGLEWLVKQRRDIFYGGLLVLGLTVLASLLFSRFITGPLSTMVRRLKSGEGKLGELAAPAELHTLGVALDERTQKLEEKSRYIAEFAATVSHELKTPLTSIRGAAELLAEQGQDMPPQQQARFLSNIDAAAERTERLVTRLLHLARLEAAERPQDGELVEVPAWAEGLKRRYAQDLELRLDGSFTQKQNPFTLETVVSNLVENALRHRATSPVHVSLKESSRGLTITVADDGPGISAENRQRVFERFFTTERDRGGTGLGLAIVKASAVQSGGTVHLDTGPQGTVVTVLLGPAL